MSKLTAMFFALALIGCSAAASVPVRGTQAQTAQLDGSWSGTARNPQGEVTSSIAFSFSTGRHTGSGAVTMPNDAGGGSTALAIEFVAVDGQHIDGKLAPYQHPACACLVETTFDGTILNDMIEGHFATVAKDQDFRRRGSWTAMRE